MLSITCDAHDFDRGLVLDALGLMAGGSRIRVVGNTACLDGMPVSPVFDFLLRFGYIRLLEEKPDEFIGQTYGITKKGYGFWQDGLAWWNALPFWKKIRVQLFGKE